jgi:hypothetical protein
MIDNPRTNQLLESGLWGSGMEWTGIQYCLNWACHSNTGVQLMLPSPNVCLIIARVSVHTFSKLCTKCDAHSLWDPLWNGIKPDAKLNSVAWVRDRTIQTERPPLVGEVRANFCGSRVPRTQRNGFLRQYSWLSRSEPLHFLPSSSWNILRRLSGPRSRPVTSHKMW